jgi:hypothetical protein
MREAVEKLVELVDGVSQRLDDWSYMQMMVYLQQIYVATPVPTRSATPYPSDIEREYYDLLSRHQRLKRANKRRNKAHRERVEALEQEVEDLQAQITYMEHRPPEIEISPKL